MPKMIYICILLIYFKVISKKGGHYCPRLPYLSHRAIIAQTHTRSHGLSRPHLPLEKHGKNIVEKSWKIGKQLKSRKLKMF